MNKIIYILFTFFSCVMLDVKAQSKNGLDANSLSARYVRFYPNPATTSINFDLQRSNNNHYSLMVFSLMGKKIAEIRNFNPHNSINLDNFYRGIYIFQLRDKNGLIIESGKFQVLR